MRILNFHILCFKTIGGKILMKRIFFAAKFLSRKLSPACATCPCSLTYWQNTFLK